MLIMHKPTQLTIYGAMRILPKTQIYYPHQKCVLQTGYLHTASRRKSALSLQVEAKILASRCEIDSTRT